MAWLLPEICCLGYDACGIPDSGDKNICMEGKNLQGYSYRRTQSSKRGDKKDRNFYMGYGGMDHFSCG